MDPRLGSNRVGVGESALRAVIRDVPLTPAPDDLTGRDLDDLDPAKTRRPTGRTDPEELPSIGATRRPTHRDSTRRLVHDQVVDLSQQIRKRIDELGEPGRETLLGRGSAGRGAVFE